jgi:hypothetical protein
MSAATLLHVHRPAGSVAGSARLLGAEGRDEVQRCLDWIARLRPLVVDAGGAVDVLAARAADAADTSAVEALLRRLWHVVTAQPPPFAGRPALAITVLPLRAFRAHGDFEDQGGNVDALVDPVTRRRRTGQEQGPWLSEIVDRDLNAVLASWGNPMDIVDEQELPAGSVVLRGLAAPMRGRGSWDGVRDVPVEVRPGGGAQIYHAGQCMDGLPVQARPAPRRVVNAYTIGPRGLPMREV